VPIEEEEEPSHHVEHEECDRREKDQDRNVGRSMPKNKEKTVKAYRSATKDSA